VLGALLTLFGFENPLRIYFTLETGFEGGLGRTGVGPTFGVEGVSRDPGPEDPLFCA
jgi:hypothetical protein